MHRLAILAEPPFRVWARDEAALGVPASNPVDTIVKKEEAQLLRRTTLVQGSCGKAATLLELRLEHVAVEDATVYQGGRDFLILFETIPADKVPASTGEELVSSWNGGFPVLLSVDGAVDAVTTQKPIGGAEEGAQAQKHVRGHDR